MDLRVFIAGTEYRATDRYTIREQVGQSSMTSIEIKLDNNPLPKTYSKVEIKLGSNPIFTGFIHEVETPMYSSTFETDIIPLQVISQESVFTRRIVNEVYKDKLTHEIVLDLFNKYILEEGYTLGTIEEFERIYKLNSIKNLKLSDVLQELADHVGATAKISPTGVFNFISQKNFMEYEAPSHITKLKMQEQALDLKTIQKISGAKAETSFQNVTVVWTLESQNIPLGYQLADEPIVSINGSIVEVGLLGIDDENITKTFLWGLENNTIVLNKNATIKPAVGQTVAVVFKGFYDIEVVAENEQLKEEVALLSGTSGKIESLVVDTSITNPQDGENKAQDLLREKSQREQTVTVMTHDIDKSELLSSWIIDKPELNINGSFVIVERTITDFYDKFKINLKLKNRGFYSRYGTVYNKHTKEINNLSIRQDDIVLKTSVIGEMLEYTDEFVSDALFMTFTAGTTDIFSPVFFEGITPMGAL